MIIPICDFHIFVPVPAICIFLPAVISPPCCSIIIVQVYNISWDFWHSITNGCQYSKTSINCTKWCLEPSSKCKFSQGMVPLLITASGSKLKGPNSLSMLLLSAAWLKALIVSHFVKVSHGYRWGGETSLNFIAQKIWVAAQNIPYNALKDWTTLPDE